MAGTVADLLNLMALLDNELEVGSGQDDEAGAVLALTHAQHHFETVAASLPRVLGTATTLVTTANTETSAWATSLLRLDAMWRLDLQTGKPVAKLEDVGSIGGHVPALPWPLQITLNPGTGAPIGYFADMANFYWLVTPDTGYTMRLYGLVEQAEFVDRTSAFNYPNRVKLPMAQFANKLLTIGVGDGIDQALDNLAVQVFKPLLRQLRKFDRSGPKSRIYSQPHLT